MENLELETLDLSEKAPLELPSYRRRRPLKSRTFDTFLRIVSECHLHFQNQEQVATVQGDRMEENNDLSIQGDRVVENNDLGTGDGLVREKSLVEEDREGDRLVENNDLGTEDGLAREKSLVNEDREGELLVLVENNDLRPEDGLARENLLVDENREGDLLVENNESRPEDGLALENSLVREDKEVVSSQELGLIGDLMDVDGDNVKSTGDQGLVDNINGIDSVIEGNQNCNNGFAAFASLLDGDDQFSLPDFDMEEFGLEEQLGEKAPCADVSELIDSLLDTDVTVGASIPIVTKDQNSSHVKTTGRETPTDERGSDTAVSASIASIPIVTKDENSSHVKTTGIETPTDARESDTPVSASIMVSSSPQRIVEGIEDGEISEVSGVLEKSSDFIHEDIIPLEKNSVNKGELSGDIIHKEGFSPNTIQRGPVKDNQYFGEAKNRVDIVSTAMNVEKGNDNRNLVDNRTQVYYGDTVEDGMEERKDSRLEFGRTRQRRARKKADSQASCPKNISLSGGSTGENTVENQCSASTEKVANQNNKKRKGVHSEERKAKKKVAIQNNEKRKGGNSEESKAKKKVANQNNKKSRGGYSEEGQAKKKKNERMKRAEKRRESGVKRLKLPPVLKPKTVTYCCHFLKGRCHEGEKCKFSHDTIPLTKSKPCCHFARQSCMKGDDCPFDHQLSKYPCNNFLSQGSCARGSNCMFSHKVPVKEGSSTASDICNPDSRSVSVKENTLKPAGQAPKGISFLSHGKVPVGNMSKHEQGALSPKADNGRKVDQQSITSASNGVESLNKNTQTPPVVPRGINFLSFGKAPSESFTKKSSFSLVSNEEIGKLSPSHPSKSERAGPLSKANVGGKVDSQTDQGASSIVQNMNETANRTPAMTPRGLGFLSVGNLQTPNPVLPPASSSPLSHDRFLGKQIDVQSKSSLSSFQGSLFSNTPSSVQRAFQSTLALAAKFESKAKNDHSSDSPAVRTDLSKAGSSSQNKFTKPSTILDFLYSGSSKTK